MKTVILCGGRGTRALPRTIEVPKPLLEVGDRPILAHVMAIYADQGFTDFVLSAGYKADLVAEFASTLPPSWSVEVADTGEDTDTGDRIAKVRHLLDGTFFATYADGLGDVDLHALLADHRAHGAGATITTVPLPSQYGTVETDAAGRVTRFREKPRLPDHRINAGFFVFDEAAFEAWSGTDLERDVLSSLAAVGMLHAHPHDGFWKSMDTYKDSQELSALCADGPGPWVRPR